VFFRSLIPFLEKSRLTFTTGDSGVSTGNIGNKNGALMGLGNQYKIIPLCLVGLPEMGTMPPVKNQERNVQYSMLNVQYSSNEN
jgi:hypothetical protein